MAATRRPKSAVTEDVFLPTSGPAIPQRAVGVAELLRRLGEAESKLATSEKDHAADAELIGNLLGELGERDRRIRDLEQRALDEESRRVELETELATLSRASNERDRTRALEAALRRTDGLFAELLQRLSAAHGGDTDVSQLHDLLAVTLTTLDFSRTITAETAKKLDDTQAAISNMGARDAARGIGETLGRARTVLDASLPLDRTIARVIDRLREIEKRERELGELRTELLNEASHLVAEVQQLRDAMGNLARRPTSIPRMRKAPSKLPTRRR